MQQFTLTLPDDQLQKLKEKASYLGTTPEELVLASINDLITRPNNEFDKTLEYVLKKNDNLYRRLA